ncbi:MAG: response regulator, partial [Sphingomonadaceae bacterium]
RWRAEAGRAGADHLFWHLAPRDEADLRAAARALLAGEAGERLGEAGVMAVLADCEGRIVAANAVFAMRAREGEPVAGLSFAELLEQDDAGRVRLAADAAGPPLRLVQVMLGAEDLILFLLLDESGGMAGALPARSENLEALLETLPLGLALVDRDGRFLFLNDAFRRAAGLDPEARPAWPGDLVVEEDKAAVSDSVRRFARGGTMTGDIAVRLEDRRDEPVVLTIAGARGMGEAAALLSLKDNSEEDRLKRQIAQQTRMQAVGQLAGGVAHDFNNILTAILGHCDLMLMRHAPGDSDYDDIQQIKSNSNRAAGLTRQLLAFSRQQTLRPQVVQLPDIVSEVSILLKRLLGEKISLVVKHGRGLGPVRADPGQIEQVIVNLAVNARDAMIGADGEGGGTLTLRTFAFPAGKVRETGSEILPVADYSALEVADTGAGIAPEILGKIFEPFFSTKEVGKGTGLGLSTVYGIVKQSGGFIFAESEPGEGTVFTIYLPVHEAAGEAAAPGPGEEAGEAERAREIWGSGTILLVEDEAVVRTVAEQALTRQGYTVLTAESGEEALEILGRGDHVDLLVSDVVMPAMDGPTMVREARESRPDLKILFMSGYAEEQLRRSLDLDEVAFLAKPFSVKQLAAAVGDALAK